MVATGHLYFRDCCEVNEKDVVSVLQRIRGIPGLNLGGGSDLAFYTSEGKKIEAEDEQERQSAPKSQLDDSSCLFWNSRIEAINEARIRYLQRKGLLK